VSHTKKYLNAGSRVLEGGCGTGVHVYNLMRHGFNCVGVDTASETVRAAKEAVPEIDIQHGDVCSLQFPDKYFDGYWSLGVIEHFQNGYAAVAHEMYRVVKPGGFVFLTFPYMSPLRRLKARFGLYVTVKQEHQNKELFNFYQFILNHKKVIKNFEHYGFELVEQHPFDGFRGIKDEFNFLDFILGSINGSRSNLVKAFKIGIGKICEFFSGHCVLLVMRRGAKKL